MDQLRISSFQNLCYGRILKSVTILGPVIPELSDTLLYLVIQLNLYSSHSPLVLIYAIDGTSRYNACIHMYSLYLEKKIHFALYYTVLLFDDHAMCNSCLYFVHCNSVQIYRWPSCICCKRLANIDIRLMWWGSIMHFKRISSHQWCHSC